MESQIGFTEHWLKRGKTQNGPCMNHRCISKSATTYNTSNHSWYCHWCAVELNAKHNAWRKAQGVTPEKLCITSKELMWQQLGANTA